MKGASTMELIELKKELATAVRMLESIQLLDMNGHLSFRIPETDRVLINARKSSRATLSVADVVMVDLEGKLVEGEFEPPSETHLHTAIYRHRKEVNSVLHNHPHWQVVLGIAGQKLQPVFTLGSFLDGNAPEYEKSVLIRTRELGEEVAERLGQEQLMSLKHHGMIVVGDNIQTVFARSVFLEENAKKQYYASLLGRMAIMEGENLENTRKTVLTPKTIKKTWDYYGEKAEREGILQGI